MKSHFEKNDSVIKGLRSVARGVYYVLPTDPIKTRSRENVP